MRCTLPLVVIAFLAACSSPGASNQFEAIRPTPAGYCSSACADPTMPSCSDWSAPELAGARIQQCIDSTPCESDPAYACGGTGSTLYNWDCYVGCVLMESRAVQDIVLANLRCDYPPAFCR